ncbi:hypothetical protein [Olivibacter sitiensis]|uniref:hypothetical protein n=1 Tax=Olivibacter sitiensis TaxID=376470 RepID=UPI0012FB7E0A|nr:hypothetical protein [Olivibacter sitiensis]
MIFADNTAFCQLFKLPILFEHYKEHKSKDDRIGFVDFLSMHYWGDDLDDDDDDRDMQLPFKKIDVHAHYLFVPGARISSVRKVAFAISASYSMSYNYFCPNPSLGSTFRPPCA